MQQENHCKLRQTSVLTSKGPAKTLLLQVHFDCCCIWDVDTAGYSSSARALDKKCHPRCKSQHFQIASNCCPCPSLPEGQHHCWQPLRETTAFLDGWVFLAVRELLSSVLWSPPVVFHQVTSWSISHDFHVSHDGSVLLLSQRDSIRTLKATLLKDGTQKRMEARVAHYLGTSPPGPTDILPLYNLIWGGTSKILRTLGSVVHHSMLASHLASSWPSHSCEIEVTLTWDWRLLRACRCLYESRCVCVCVRRCTKYRPVLQ